MRDNDFSGPAFPVQPYEGIAFPRFEDGISVRDYFAAKAIPALLTVDMIKAGGSLSEELSREVFDLFAATAYEMADAMLLERAK